MGSTKHPSAGLERDSETSLQRTWFRQYSSAYARWCSADPLGGSTTDPQSLNRYAYVQNDPVNLIDPEGLDSLAALLGLAGLFHPYTVIVVRDSLGLHELGGRGGGGGSWADTAFVAEGGEVEGPGGGAVPIHSQLELFFQSARLPGETFSQCFNRTQRALLGQRGQDALHVVSGLSLATEALTYAGNIRLAPQGSAIELPARGTVPRPRPATLIQTELRGTSVAEKVVAKGLSERSIAGTASTVAKARSAASIVSKVAAVPFAISLGLEGGFALACR